MNHRKSVTKPRGFVKIQRLYLNGFTSLCKHPFATNKMIIIHGEAKSNSAKKFWQTNTNFVHEIAKNESFAEEILKNEKWVLSFEKIQEINIIKYLPKETQINTIEFLAISCFLNEQKQNFLKKEKIDQFIDQFKKEIPKQVRQSNEKIFNFYEFAIEDSLKEKIKGNI